MDGSSTELPMTIRGGLGGDAEPAPKINNSSSQGGKKAVAEMNRAGPPHGTE